MSRHAVSGMSIVSFFEWLATTPGSVALHESRYLYLVVLTVHVMTLSVFVGTAVIVDLRLLGFMLSRIRASEVVTRLLPWNIGGFLMMAVSGSLLFFAAPLDKYGNVFFRAKMVMLILAGLVVWAFFKTVYARVDDWDRDPIPPPGARIAGGLALAFWAAIITAGRMIAYQQYWFD